MNAVVVSVHTIHDVRALGGVSSAQAKVDHVRSSLPSQVNRTLAVTNTTDHRLSTQENGSTTSTSVHSITECHVLSDNSFSPERECGEMCAPQKQRLNLLNQREAVIDCRPSVSGLNSAENAFASLSTTSQENTKPSEPAVDNNFRSETVSSDLLVQVSCRHFYFLLPVL